MGTVKSEDERKSGPLTFTREPKRPARAGETGSVGDQALKDAVLIIAVGWALLFLLAFSLRKHNV